ncbi:hypothetical protein MHH85_10680 [Viridibacillus sp. FSL E2-0187]|uniref:hypothetical protein n=1 Tax=Viridibacillus TaxID=496496 RepID=UPI0030F9B37B
MKIIELHMQLFFLIELTGQFSAISRKLGIDVELVKIEGSNESGGDMKALQNLVIS